MSPRAAYALAAAALLAVEVAIALWMHDRVIRPFVGDMLAVALVYCVVRMATRLRSGPAACTAFAIAGALEVSQAFHLVDLLGLGRIALARVVLGTFFDVRDFLAYALGAIGAFLLDRLARRTR